MFLYYFFSFLLQALTFSKNKADRKKITFFNCTSLPKASSEARQQSLDLLKKTYRWKLKNQHFWQKSWAETVQFYFENAWFSCSFITLTLEVRAFLAFLRPFFKKFTNWARLSHQGFWIYLLAHKHTVWFCKRIKFPILLIWSSVKTICLIDFHLIDLILEKVKLWQKKSWKHTVW